jgi:hypothetical protein
MLGLRWSLLSGEVPCELQIVLLLMLRHVSATNDNHIEKATVFEYLRSASCNLLVVHDKLRVHVGAILQLYNSMQCY